MELNKIVLEIDVIVSVVLLLVLLRLFFFCGTLLIV